MIKKIQITYRRLKDTKVVMDTSKKIFKVIKTIQIRPLRKQLIHVYLILIEMLQ